MAYFVGQLRTLSRIERLLEQYHRWLTSKLYLIVGTKPRAAGPREWEFLRHHKDNLSVYQWVRLTNRKVESSSQLFLNWTIRMLLLYVVSTLGVKLVIIHAKAARV